MLNQGFAFLNAVVKSGSFFLAVFLIRLYFLLIRMRGSVNLNYWPEFVRLVYYGSDQTRIRIQLAIFVVIEKKIFKQASIF